VLAYLRKLDDDLVLCVNNLSRFAQPVELMLTDFAGKVPVELLGRVPFPPIGELPYFVTLQPYSFYWFSLLDWPGQDDEP
jgi:maltose alpha-D-glucosyltransferase/alpha-amylase